VAVEPADALTEQGSRAILPVVTIPGTAMPLLLAATAIAAVPPPLKVPHAPEPGAINVKEWLGIAARATHFNVTARLRHSMPTTIDRLTLPLMILAGTVRTDDTDH
jgi:hypothetical protein